MVNVKIVENRIGDLDQAIASLRERLDATGLSYHHYSTMGGADKVIFHVDFDDKNALALVKRALTEATVT
jgi:hypothetical protein